MAIGASKKFSTMPIVITVIMVMIAGMMTVVLLKSLEMAWAWNEQGFIIGEIAGHKANGDGCFEQQTHY